MNLNITHEQSPFTVDITANDKALVIRLAGELDLPATEILRSTVTADTANGAPSALVDLAGLDFCDAAGIRELIGVQRRLTNGRRPVTFHGLRPHIRRLMTITGADQRLNLRRLDEPSR